jgi:hypothetical protein
MLYSHAYPRTADAPVNADLGPHDPIPPEAWRDCRSGVHLVKRRVVLDGGKPQTVATCAKCGAIIETLPHPKATTGESGRAQKPHTSPDAEACHTAVRVYLAANGPATARGMAEALGINRRTMAYHLSRIPGIVKTKSTIGASHRPEFWWGLA